MKKTLIYLTLTLFLFNSLGYYILFEVNRQFARKEMQSLLLHSPSQRLLLKLTDIDHNIEFQRIDKREFRYKGHMYDIVREVKSGTSVIFICVLDKKESRLFAALKQEQQNRLHSTLLDHLVMIFLHTPAVNFTAALSGDWLFPGINIPLKSTIIANWSPPPEQG